MHKGGPASHGGEGAERTSVTWQARVAMPTVILTWGLGPPATKLIGAAPMAAVLVRFALSSLVLLGVALATKRRPWRLRNRWLIPAGLAFGLNNAAFFFAIQHASIVVVSVIFALQPAVVLVVAGPFLQEHPTGWHVAWTVVAIAGTAMVVTESNSRVITDRYGILLAALAMMALSAYHVLTRVARSIDPVDALDWMAAVTTIACLGLAPVAAATTSTDEYLTIGAKDLALIGFVAIVVGVVGHTLMSWVHRGIPANRSAVYLLLFNVVAVAAAWAVNGQSVTPAQAVGGAIVMVAAGAIAVRARDPKDLEPSSTL